MRNESNAHDAAFLDAFDLEVATLMVHLVTALQNASGTVHQETGNGCVPAIFRNVEFKILVRVAHTQHAVEHVRLAVSLDLLAHFFVKLVVNLADDLFQQILNVRIPSMPPCSSMTNTK